MKHKRHALPIAAAQTKLADNLFRWPQFPDSIELAKPLTPGVRNAPARFRQFDCRIGNSMADAGACATASDAGDRLSRWRHRHG
jgi:hypothetical protein